jgi:hypothetical protein
MNYFEEKLVKIRPISGYRVWVEFEDGFSAELDLGPLLDMGPVFAPLGDPAIFSSPRIEWGVPVWSEDLDLPPGAVRAWAEEGRVLSREETGQWWLKRAAPSAQAAMV